MNYPPEGYIINRLENSSALSDLTKIEDAIAGGTVFEAKADMCTSNHEIIINLPCIKAIMPREEVCIGIREGKTKDIAVISRVGKPVCFKVIDIRYINGEKLAIVSRRAVQEDCMRDYLLKLQGGEVIDATVTHIEQFGCFVDIGSGIPSMIPIDEISISRIASPFDRFSVGDRIKVVYKRFDGEKFYISHKELLGTWQENADMFKPGETVRGVVRSVESYGVFVELTPNLAGLAEPNDNVKAGQTASVYIKSINPDKMKIKLIIVDCCDSPLKMNNTYFITDGVLSRWRYSPESCCKVIETVF